MDLNLSKSELIMRMRKRGMNGPYDKARIDLLNWIRNRYGFGR